MIEIRNRDKSDEFPCPYLDQQARNEFFFAMELNFEEINKLLAEGWRKFGWYYFRPACDNCQACIPLRILTNEFKASRSQRKVINKNTDTQMQVKPLEFRDEIFELYKKHSMQRFNQTSAKQEFIETHFYPSCPGLQTEYYRDNKLVATGFLDRGSNSLSSVYFIYDTDYSHLSLGVYGALKEIALAQKMALDYYYLGYWIAANKSMRYKNKFYPHELMDWKQEKWQRVDKRH